MKDTAYTNLALPAHTDNTYFSDPSGLQAFHLLSHTDGSGGESLLVDGFHAASILLKEDKNSFEILERAQIPWHASGNEGIAIKPFKDFPVFNSGTKREGFRPELVQIRWNNDDRGVVPLVGDLGVTAERWYKAARKWNAILKRANMEYWTQLKPGRMLSTSTHAGYTIHVLTTTSLR
jgi:trimethyllysine dioxygenase